MANESTHLYTVGTVVNANTCPEGSDGTGGQEAIITFLNGFHFSLQFWLFSQHNYDKIFSKISASGFLTNEDTGFLQS